MLSAARVLLPGSRMCRGPISGTFLGLTLPGLFFLVFGGGFLLLFAHRLRGAGEGARLSNFDTTERNMSLLHKLGALVTAATGIGLLVECGGSWLAGCGPFSAHLFPGQELYLAFLIAGGTTLAEGRSLLSIGAHRYALALALFIEAVLYLLHSTSFEEPRTGMFRVLALLSLGGGTASLVSALQPKLALVHACAHGSLIGQGGWFFYMAFQLRHPFEHPLRGLDRSFQLRQSTVPLVSSVGVYVAAFALVSLVTALTAVLVIAARKHATAGGYAFLVSHDRTQEEDDAELGAHKGK